MFLLSMAFPPYTWLFILIALLAGLSRVYLGLHYPSDVLGGYALGLLVGFSVWWGMEKVKYIFQSKKKIKSKITLTTKAQRAPRTTGKKKK